MLNFPPAELKLCHSTWLNRLFTSRLSNNLRFRVTWQAKRNRIAATRTLGTCRPPPPRSLQFVPSSRPPHGSRSPRNESVPRPRSLAPSRTACSDQLQSRPREGNPIGSMPCPSKQLQFPIRLEGGQSAPHGGAGEAPRQSQAVLPTFSLCFQPSYGLTLVKLMAGAQALPRPVLQSQPSLSIPEETPNPQEALLSLGETEAEGARLAVFLESGRSAF